MLLLLLAAQAGPPAAPMPTPVVAASSAPAKPAWSILQPQPDEKCSERLPGNPEDIVVCGRQQRLPYPELASDPARPVNRDLTGTGALAAQGTPCAARMGGCTTGVDVFGAGTQAIRLVQKLVAPSSCCEDPGEGKDPVRLAADAVHGVGKAFRKKTDKSQRVAIALDDAPVETASHVSP